MAFHDSFEHSLQPSGVILGGHDHNRSEMMLVAPWRQHLTFSFGSINSRDLYDMRPNIDCSSTCGGRRQRRPRLQKWLPDAQLLASGLL
jgi:hypothetical protein